MDDNFGEWVESMGVVSGCCCKEVYIHKYPHNNYYFFPTPLVLALFWQQHPYLFVHFLNVFSFFITCFRSDIRCKYMHVCLYALRHSRTAYTLYAIAKLLGF